MAGNGRKVTILLAIICLAAMIVAVIVMKQTGFLGRRSMAGDQQNAESIRIVIRQDEIYLKRSEVYSPVGQVLALYCQSDQKLLPEILDKTWFPAAQVGRFRHCWGTVNPSEASLEFGGGLHHFGYRLTLDAQKSLPGTKLWHLFFYSDDMPDMPLQTIIMPSLQRIPDDQILKHREQPRPK
jgi:hypothetical protein